MVTRLNDPRFMKMFKERLMKTETIEQFEALEDEFMEARPSYWAYYDEEMLKKVYELLYIPSEVWAAEMNRKGICTELKMKKS